MRLTLNEIAACLKQDAHFDSHAAIDGAAIDSRKVKPGDLFLCLQGSNADGHDYAHAAQAGGCGAILAGRRLDLPGVPVIVVPDVERAFADLARFCRAKTCAKVLCLTGTAGKTTLKDTLAAIMRQKGKVAATEGNLNNQLGLPLTILNASGQEDYWILEAGISHTGDMDLLGSMARPDVALILNVGPGHTEGLGEMGVAKNKARLLRYVAPGGAALVNADYPDLVAAAMEYKLKLDFFSRDPNADCRFRLLPGEAGLQRIDLAGKAVSFRTPFKGIAGSENALAAAAAAFLLGADVEEIQKGFQNVHLPGQRYCEMELACGVHLVDDTYNANPLSMSRSLSEAALEAAKRGNAFIAVLGTMGELGSVAEKQHLELGRSLARLKPKAVFWKGRHGDDVQKGLDEAGCSLKLLVAETPAEFTETWKRENLPFDCVTVIFKGSRANRLETYSQAFQALAAARAR